MQGAAFTCEDNVGSFQHFVAENDGDIAQQAACNGADGALEGDLCHFAQHRRRHDDDRDGRPLASLRQQHRVCFACWHQAKCTDACFGEILL